MGANAGFERLDLFDDEDALPIEGLSYHENYVTAEEEAAIIAEADGQPWSTELLRRRQWYGGAYDDTMLRHPDEYQPQPMPEWLTGLAARLCHDGYFPRPPDTALINEYHSGQGIGAHKDREPLTLRTVAIISLGSAIMMDFSRRGYATRSHYLRPRSLVIMRGEARNHWCHGITGRKTDRVGGVVIPRGRRLSVTFRGGDMAQPGETVT
ncbi:MAG: alpha-ketoglutarate-dependent dioxygenase AlkB [Asticcacaulis sp.]